jgi:threonine dehydrogenase-like Zn-dependent dehydrogenase
MNENSMKAVFFRQTGALSVEETPVREPKANEVQIRIELNTLCNSTDGEIIDGLRPHKTGVILGHESCGTVSAAGSLVTKFNIGDRVTFDYWGSFAEFLCVPEEKVLPVPENLSWEEAALSELTYKVCHMGLGQIWPGDTAVILGQGPAGLLYTQLCRLSGASRIVVTDPSPMKRALALELGATAAIDSNDPQIAELVLDATGGRGGDVVIEAAGRAAAAELAPHVARPYGARIIQFGVVAEPATYTFRHIHDKGITILSYGSFKDRTDRFSFERALQLLSERKIDVSRFITHSYPLERINEAFSKYKTDTDSVIKIKLTH